MKKKVVFVIAALMLLSMNSYAADKIGFIDVPKLLSSSVMGKRALAEVKKIREAENAGITRMSTELEGLKDKFRAESQKKDAGQAELKMLIDEIQLKDKELKRLVDDAKEKITKKGREHMVEILLKADPILKDIAKSKGYSIILRERNTIAYLDPAADVTDEVINKLNSLKK